MIKIDVKLISLLGGLCFVPNANAELKNINFDFKKEVNDVSIDLKKSKNQLSKKLKNVGGTIFMTSNSLGCFFWFVNDFRNIDKKNEAVFRRVFLLSNLVGSVVWLGGAMKEWFEDRN